MTSKKRWITTTLFVLYCAFIVWYTLFTRTPKSNRQVDFRLFWAYREWLAGSANGKKDVLQNLSNIVFFVPFGMLFPVKKWKAVLSFSALFSILIEALQYILGLGLCELDDVICNALGAMIGFWIIMWLKKAVRSIDET